MDWYIFTSLCIMLEIKVAQAHTKIETALHSTYTAEVNARLDLLLDWPWLTGLSRGIFMEISWGSRTPTEILTCGLRAPQFGITNMQNNRDQDKE